ncbi:hypothetical protein BGZ54_002908 [Gamsiella multidivaricata]|nr:hypothetical protein BGZ54_002908 [Gamsiella multidivaricata]
MTTVQCQIDPADIAGKTFGTYCSGGYTLPVKDVANDIRTVLAKWDLEVTMTQELRFQGTSVHITCLLPGAGTMPIQNCRAGLSYIWNISVLNSTTLSTNESVQPNCIMVGDDRTYVAWVTI